MVFFYSPVRNDVFGKTPTTMVRLKDRYLLVNIVYADIPPGQKGPVPDLLLYNQPTIGELRPQTILKGIRSQVNALFGDCGSGSVERSLQGKHTTELLELTLGKSGP